MGGAVKLREGLPKKSGHVFKKELLFTEKKHRLGVFVDFFWACKVFLKKHSRRKVKIYNIYCLLGCSPSQDAILESDGLVPAS